MLGVVPDQIFGATQGGYVGDAADDQTRSGLELDTLLARDDRSHLAFAVGKELLVLIALAGIENQPVVGAEDLGLFFRDEVSIRAADELLVRPAEKITHRAVDDDEAMLGVLDEHGARHGVEDDAESIKVAEQSGIQGCKG